ncbi:cytochrome c oxidase cbb3-type subunit 3/ubiquinol-cytochrome c reductase cytochrome c subunit [Granulicella rosea]|uniref:Cytochrome c oxidase cbb3-type subunit 3/ubiquinol-cytochrome c reductase cytochrome c subunit n=1 Tax=Granulicella rosea TaxID=474952 RepID=A0A239GRM8_9BACT|nr:c-type cytochrome [Granulicella rosea]SNS71879.1 cytochrome c oxidase cbb3-type subunit 3/ubiquinol-cytochrome c reductase cytochrome c subunit [Granulicella rosea]
MMPKPRSAASLFLTSLLLFASAGCKDAPGKPKFTAETQRPDQVIDFPTLYQQNCSACHGANGSKGAAISLSNPVYLATAGEAAIQNATTNGIPGTLMPAFAIGKGGMLTDQQIAILARGMVEVWGRPSQLQGQAFPTYASSTTGDATAGHIAYTSFCSRCHGVDGAGIAAKISAQHSTEATGSIIDPAYLALVSDQSLRSTIIAGKPEDHMPDWRSDASGPNALAMTDQQITDTVTWLASHRIATPGQPYREHP